MTFNLFLHLGKVHNTYTVTENYKALYSTHLTLLFNLVESLNLFSSILSLKRLEIKSEIFLQFFVQSTLQGWS